jgi:Zn-dependent peptidase ImmA (M78 family)/O-acetyl-ADP-ribose deacetylase (regulator of RNase III)
MTFWTNESVLALAPHEDPEQAIVFRAQQLALEAMSEGWLGPPYDPFDLAERMGIEVVARDDLYDAQIRQDGERLVIEYNPSRPRGRVRYNVAHELAHALFPDVRDKVRRRLLHEETTGDEWQLEMLCNIAAGELLMPAGTFPELTNEGLDIERLMTLRTEYDVSTEALLLRVAKLSEQATTIFAASRADPHKLDAPLRIDYWRGSSAWTAGLRRGRKIPKESTAYACTAVGYTSRGDESWADAGDVHVEVVGIPPYPGHRLPRVVGLLRPTADVVVPPRPTIAFVTGDATRPHGNGPRLIAHVVNDKTPNWGGAFAQGLRDEYPIAQSEFRQWVNNDRTVLQLGAVHVAEVDTNLVVATMVAQRGYGTSQRPRLRYDALRAALISVAEEARRRDASVHMPRIGAGMAGGDWQVIVELISTELTGRGVPTTVYSLPGSEWSNHQPRQESLTFAE